MSSGVLPSLYSAAFSHILRSVWKEISSESLPKLVAPILRVQEKGNQSDHNSVNNNLPDEDSAPSCAPPSTPILPQFSGGGFSFYPATRPRWKETSKEQDLSCPSVPERFVRVRNHDVGSRRNGSTKFCNYRNNYTKLNKPFQASPNHGSTALVRGDPHAAPVCCDPPAAPGCCTPSCCTDPVCGAQLLEDGWQETAKEAESNPAPSVPKGVLKDVSRVSFPIPGKKKKQRKGQIDHQEEKVCC